jgi:hypothetical protein
MVAVNSIVVVTICFYYLFLIPWKDGMRLLTKICAFKVHLYEAELFIYPCIVFDSFYILYSCVIREISTLF